MITDNGKTHIKRYLARYIPNIAESIAFGIGATAEASGDQRLDFEIGRADIRVTAYDFNNDVLIFKAVLPQDLNCIIYELGLYSVSVDSAAGTASSKVLTLFDSVNEGWKKGSDDSASAYVGDNSRAGTDALFQNPATSATAFDYLNDITYDLSAHSSADTFKVAFYTGNANNHTSKFRLMTDTSNYFEGSIPAQSVGYHIISVAKGAMTAVGTPDWSRITRIEARTTASGTGAANMQWDSLRIDDVDTVNPGYVLVARKVLATPYVKVAGKQHEAEFALEVNIG